MDSSAQHPPRQAASTFAVPLEVEKRVNEVILEEPSKEEVSRDEIVVERLELDKVIPLSRQLMLNTSSLS